MQASVPLAGGPEVVALDIASEPFFEDPVERAEQDRRALRRLSVALGLAILFHLLIAVITVVTPDWWRRADPPKVIPITLVAEPPPPPPPPPPAEKPAPPPPPEPPAVPYARSGPDEKMASATPEKPQPAPTPMPQASEPAPEKAPQPSPAPPKQAAPPTPQRPVPAPEATRPVAKPLPAPKPATPTATPRTRPKVSIGGLPPGKRDMIGDTYLNLLTAKILARYRYPFGEEGLIGTAVFVMTLARDGDIADLEPARSSGDNAIDLYAEEIIRRSAPLPPVPSKYPGDTLRIIVFITVEPK